MLAFLLSLGMAIVTGLLGVLEGSLYLMSIPLSVIICCYYLLLLLLLNFFLLVFPRNNHDNSFWPWEESRTLHKWQLEAVWSQKNNSINGYDNSYATSRISYCCLLSL